MNEWMIKEQWKQCSARERCSHALILIILGNVQMPSSSFLSRHLLFVHPLFCYLVLFRFVLVVSLLPFLLSVRFCEPLSFPLHIFLFFFSFSFWPCLFQLWMVSFRSSSSFLLFSSSSSSPHSHSHPPFFCFSFLLPFFLICLFSSSFSVSELVSRMVSVRSSCFSVLFHPHFFCLFFVLISLSSFFFSSSFSFSPLSVS